MKRLLPPLAAILAILASPAPRADEPGPPEAAARRALDDLGRGRLDAFLAAVHPESPLRPRVEPGRTPAAASFEVVGPVAAGEGEAYVVYRAAARGGGPGAEALGAVHLKKCDGAWKLWMVDDFAARLAGLDRGAPGRSISNGWRPARPSGAEGAPPKAKPPAPERASAGPDAWRRSLLAKADAALRELAAHRPKKPPAAIPAGAVGVPPSFFGGDRDGFVDLAPEGGVLVGVRVTYVDKFGGPKIGSVRPVYRVGEALVDGRLHGTLRGEEVAAVAAPGYAVGALRTHAGLMVDGFQLVFRKVDGDRLDPADSCDSAWLGDRKGGGPRDADVGCRTPVGLQGRAGDDVAALGLIVKE